jgi:hypothetical protein
MQVDQNSKLRVWQSKASELSPMIIPCHQVCTGSLLKSSPPGAKSSLLRLRDKGMRPGSMLFPIFFCGGRKQLKSGTMRQGGLLPLMED